MMAKFILKRSKMPKVTYQKVVIVDCVFSCSVSFHCKEVLGAL